MLMFEAYQGTVDDDGETLEDALAEVEGTFNGRYGRWIADASFILRSSEGSGIIAASLLTLYQGLPLLAFSMTHPRYPRRGHARSLITASIAALQDRGTAGSRHCRIAALQDRGTAGSRHCRIAALQHRGTAGARLYRVAPCGASSQ